MRKRILLLVMGLLLMASTAFAMTGRAIVTDFDDYTNARSGPGVQYSIISRVYYGNVFNLVEYASGWYRIYLHGNGSAWVSEKMLGFGTEVNRSGYINADNSNARSGPSSSSRLRGVFSQGDNVYVELAYDGWCYVNTHGSERVWVYGDYVSYY